jgi:hypothetical protein
VKWLTPRCRGPRRFLIVRPSVGHVPNAGPGPRRVECGSTKTDRRIGSATRPSPDTTEKPRPIRPSRTLGTSPMRQRMISSLEWPSAVSCSVDLGAFHRRAAGRWRSYQRPVGLPVAAAVQSVPLGHAGGVGQRRDTAQRGEGWFAADPGRVITEGDQQSPDNLQSASNRRVFDRGPSISEASAVATLGGPRTAWGEVGLRGCSFWWFSGRPGPCAGRDSPGRRLGGRYVGQGVVARGRPQSATALLRWVVGLGGRCRRRPARRRRHQ